MAVLQTFREKAGLAISIIIALALLSFIIDPSTLETAMNSMSSKFDVGRIAGKNISLTDFQEEVDNCTAINEIITGSSVSDENTQKQIREMAWQGMLDKFMFIKSAREAGLSVGDDELQNLLSGDNPSPLVARNPLFCDEQGVFDSQKVVEFVSAVASDETGRAKAYWDYLQNTIYTNQFHTKYNTLFTASATTNKLMADRAVAENNASANVEYVLNPYSMAPDSTIKVEASEIKAFYNAHKKNFKQEESREIEYVVFEVVPSETDIQANEADFNKAYEEFATAENVKAFCLKNSDEPFNDRWYGKGELSVIDPAIDDFAFSSTTGVSQIVKNGNTLLAARVIDSAMKSDSVFVRHLLFAPDNGKLADSLLTVVRSGADFAALAAEYSLDKNSAADGELGNIGWMTQNYLIPGFEELLDANAGQAIIIDTQYGKHIAQVTKKTAPVLKKKVAVLSKTALASKETFNTNYSKASNFVALAGGKLEGFEKAADSLKVVAFPASITYATSQFGGVDNAKEITRWAFDAKPGKSSEILTVNQNYFFVAALKGINKEGYAPLEKVAPLIENKLYSDKAMDKAKEEAAAAVEGKTDLEQIAAAFNTTVNNDESLTFSILGNRAADPALLGAAFAAEEGKLVGPVKGAFGIYFLKVNSREAGSYYTEDDAKVFEQQKAQYSSQAIMEILKDAYEVVDNREKFY